MCTFSRCAFLAAGLLAGCATPPEPPPPGAQRMIELAERPGFVVREQGGALWIRRTEQEDAAKPATLIGAGPGGCVIKAPDRQTALEFLATKPGFTVAVEDAEIWVRRDNEERVEEPVTMVGEGPRGMTVKAASRDTALVYLATTPGFEVEVDGEELWVFTAGTPHRRAVMSVMRVGVGPSGLTLRAIDNKTIDAYLAVRAELGDGGSVGATR